MSDEVVSGLLGSIPRGEEIKDQREGDHLSARLADVELVEQSNGYAIKASFSGLADSDDNSFDYQDRVTIATHNSEDFIKRLFLSALHDFGIVPRSERQAIYAETDEHRAELLAAFKSKVGTNYPLRLKVDKNGYLRGRMLRQKGV